MTFFSSASCRQGSWRPVVTERKVDHDWPHRKSRVAWKVGLLRGKTGVFSSWLRSCIHYSFDFLMTSEFNLFFSLNFLHDLWDFIHFRRIYSRLYDSKTLKLSILEYLRTLWIPVSRQLLSKCLFFIISITVLGILVRFWREVGFFKTFFISIISKLCFVFW